MSPSPLAPTENDILLTTTTMMTRLSALNDMMEDLEEPLPIDEGMLLTSSSSSMEYFPHSSLLERHVSFGGVQTVAYIESSRDMNPQDFEDRWFSPAELSEFKKSARTLCKEAYQGKPISALESTRGMEVYFPSRQRSHAKYVFHVLQAYHVRCSGDHEHVAQLCTTWSAKSRERSMASGIEDFYAAYLVPTPIPQAGGTSRSRQSSPSRSQSSDVAHHQERIRSL